MPNSSFSQSAQQWLSNGKISQSFSGGSSSNSVSFSKDAQAWLSPSSGQTSRQAVVAPIKPSSKPVSTQPSVFQNIQNEGQKLVQGSENIAQNVINQVKGIFTPTGGKPQPITVKTPTPGKIQLTQSQQQSIGQLKPGQVIPDFVSPQTSTSASLKKSSNIIDNLFIDPISYLPASIQKPAKKAQNEIEQLFPETIKQVQGLGLDALNLKSNPTKAIGDAWNSLKSSVTQEKVNINNAFTAKTTSTKVGTGAKVIAGAGGVIFSPITALFNAANDIPVLGSVAKLITIPFTLVGETAIHASNKIIDELPIPQQAKNDIKPGIAEITSLAAQLALGKASEVGARKAALVDRFGTEDAKTIIDQAQRMANSANKDLVQRVVNGNATKTEIAQYQTLSKAGLLKQFTQAGHAGFLPEKTGLQQGSVEFTPQQAQSIVINSNLENTPLGKELLKSSVEADRNGQNIKVDLQKGGEGKLKTPGGVNATNIELVEPSQTLPETTTGETPAKTKEVAPAQSSSLPAVSEKPTTTPFDTPEIVKARSAQSAEQPTSTSVTPERQALRSAIADHLYKNGGYADPAKRPTIEIQNNRRADIVIGPPASGKSSVIVDPLVKQHGSILIDNDEGKKMIPEFQGGKFAGKVHQESSDIVDRQLFKQAVSKGNNIVTSIVGRSPDRLRVYEQELHALGYEVHLHYNEVSPEEAAKRAVTRFQETGRFVDPAYALHDVGLKPGENYARMKTEGNYDSYTKFNNEVAKGEPAKLIERLNKYENARRNNGTKPIESSQRAATGTEKPKQITQKPLASTQEQEKLYHVISQDNLEKVNNEGFKLPSEKSIVKEVKKDNWEVYDRTENEDYISLTPSKKFADQYSTGIKNPTILSFNKSDFNIADPYKNPKSENESLIDYKNRLSKLGFDGFVISYDGKVPEVAIFNTKKLTSLHSNQSKKLSEIKGISEPVGTGKPKDSRAFKRFVEQLKEEDPKRYEELKDNKVKYNTLNLEKDAENAMKLVETDPEKAYRIAKGVESAPAGQTETAISIALANRALEEKNYTMQADLEASRSLRQTRRGQEIVSERGRFNDNSPHVYIQKLLAQRLNQIGRSLTTDLKDEMLKDKLSAKQGAVKLIDRQVENLSKKIKARSKKEALTLDVQKFIDDLICK